MSKLEGFCAENNIEPDEFDYVINYCIFMSCANRVITLIDRDENARRALLIKRRSHPDIAIRQFVKKNISLKMHNADIVRISNIVEKKLTANGKENVSIFKEALYKKSNGCCCSCGTRVSLESAEVDHLIPYSYVGDELNYEGNLQILCKGCNGSKSNNPLFPYNFLIENGTFPLYFKSIKNSPLSKYIPAYTNDSI